MLEARHELAVVIHKVEHTADVHLRQRLKDRMVDWLVARRILQSPTLAFPRGRDVKVAIFPGTDSQSAERQAPHTLQKTKASGA